MFLYIALGSAPVDFWIGTVASLVSIVVAGISIVLALVVQWKVSRRRALTYEVVTDAPLTSVEKEIQGVQLDAERAKDTRLVVLKLWNSGNIAIKPEDYTEPLTFLFKERKIIGTSIGNAPTKEPIHLKIISEGEAVELPATLLNPKESITMNIVLKGPQGETIVQGRIAGVAAISQG